MRTKRRQPPLAARGCAAAALALALLCACDSRRRLEVTVCGNVTLPGSGSALCDPEAVDPDPGATEVTTVSVQATTDLGEQLYFTSVDMCEWDLPFTVTLYEGWDVVTLEATGWGPGGLVRSTARPSFPPSGVRELHLGLTKDCLNVRCDPDRTCVDGICELLNDGWGSGICH